MLEPGRRDKRDKEPRLWEEVAEGQWWSVQELRWWGQVVVEVPLWSVEAAEEPWWSAVEEVP